MYIRVVLVFFTLLGLSIFPPRRRSHFSTNFIHIPSISLSLQRFQTPDVHHLSFQLLLLVVFLVPLREQPPGRRVSKRRVPGDDAIRRPMSSKRIPYPGLSTTRRDRPVCSNPPRGAYFSK